MTVRLWSRAKVQGETVLYCPETSELGLYVDGSILPLNVRDVGSPTLKQLRAARPDIAECDGAFYLRAEQSFGWSGHSIEYFSGVERGNRVAEVPEDVRRAFGDIRNPRATPDGLEDKDEFSPSYDNPRGFI